MGLYDEIHHQVFRLLETELPSFLTYHSPQHTSYVIHQAEILAAVYEVKSKDLFMVRTAALFHDIGFIRQYKNHEDAGCDIAAEFLKHFISEEDIRAICGIIMATKIPQSPVTLHEKIVCDADLEYLGTDQFYPVSQLLFQELHYIDHELDHAGFRQVQIDFLNNHHYHTEFCKTHREPRKQIHLRQLLEEQQGVNGSV